MPTIQNEDTMEVDNEEIASFAIQSLGIRLNEIFEQMDFIKIKEKIKVFNHAKLEYKTIFLNKVSQYLENFKSEKLDKLLKDYFKEPILVTLNEKKINTLIENISSNRLELLQRGFKDIKKELIQNPKELINLIQALQKKNSFKARIEFNKQLKNFPFLKNPLNVKEDNVQLLTNLNQQVNKLIELIEQHEFINILNDMIHELESYKVIQNKGQELLSKHLEKNKFIEVTLFANNNADENINLLLELIDPKTHVGIIDSANAPKIVDILLSIFAEKDVKKTEACFPLLYRLIESKFLNVEQLKLLLNNLLITSDKCTWFVNRIIQQIDSEKQHILDEGLKTSVQHLRLNNVKLLLNLGANPNQIEAIRKKFQEEFEDKKNKDQHKKQKFKELFSILQGQESVELIKPKILTNSVERNKLLITDIIAIMCADTKRAKQNHPINEELCQTIIDKYKTTIDANISEDYQTNLLRLMQKGENSFTNELEKFIQLNTSNKTSTLNYLLSQAVCMTNIKAVQLLVKNGANPKIIDAQGNTLLHLAARNNQLKEIRVSIIELIKILINEGVDKQAKNKKGDTLFNQAIQAKQQYLIDFLSLNSRPDAAKRIRLNLSNGRQRLITDQKILESELRKIEKGKLTELNSSDISELVKAWKVITNFDQFMSKIQIENDEDALNDYLKNFNKEYHEADLECLKSLYVDAINIIKKKLNNLERPMQKFNDQDELAASLMNMKVAAKQPKLGEVSTMFRRALESSESSLKHKQCSRPHQATSEDQAMEVSLSFAP